MSLSARGVHTQEREHQNQQEKATGEQRDLVVLVVHCEEARLRARLDGVPVTHCGDADGLCGVIEAYLLPLLLLFAVWVAISSAYLSQQPCHCLSPPSHSAAYIQLAVQLTSMAYHRLHNNNTVNGYEKWMRRLHRPSS